MPVVVTEPPLPSGADDGANAKGASDAERLARYRLVIEQGARAGSFVYKTLDRKTGEVVRQLPSEEIMKMRQSDGYGAGAVIDTSA